MLVMQASGWRRIASLLALLLACVLPRLDAVEDQREFDLPGGDAASALKLFSEQSGRGVIVGAAVIEGVSTDRVKGRYTAVEALALMLSRTGLVARQDEKTKAFAIVRSTGAATTPQKKNPGRAGERDGVPRTDGRTDTQTKTPMRRLLPNLAAGLAALLLPPDAPAQKAPSTPAPSQETVTLSPFEVVADDTGYVATSTLGGTLIRTNLSDIGSAISVYTKEFLEDIAAFDNETLLAFTVNADVGGVRGTFVNANSQGEENDNFGNGNSNTRVRGLAAADNTTDYFKSDVPWDGYSVERIDMIRGANSLLFGLGSPAGIINATQMRATNRNRGRMTLRVDEHGTRRVSLEMNRVLRPNELSARLALLSDHTKYQQDLQK
jgi:hypothetical protein